MKKILIILSLFLLIGVASAETFPIDRENLIIRNGYIVLARWFCYPNSARVWHGALDIPAQKYAPTRATTIGTVSEQDYDYPKQNSDGTWRDGYGNFVKIKMHNGHTKIYAHLQKAYVNVGDGVSEGDLIGQVGSTGLIYSDGRPRTAHHLHLEERDESGNKVNFTRNFTNNVVKDKNGIAFILQ